MPRSRIEPPVIIANVFLKFLPERLDFNPNKSAITANAGINIKKTMPVKIFNKAGISKIIAASENKKDMVDALLSFSFLCVILRIFLYITPKKIVFRFFLVLGFFNNPKLVFLLLVKNPLSEIDEGLSELGRYVVELPNTLL